MYYPRMELGTLVARDLARLQCILVSMIGTAEGSEAQEQLEGHMRIAKTLRMFREAPERDALDALDAVRGKSDTGRLADSLLAGIPDGQE